MVAQKYLGEVTDINCASCTRYSAKCIHTYSVTLHNAVMRLSMYFIPILQNRTLKFRERLNNLNKNTDSFETNHVAPKPHISG